jgi:hypothetical protein
VRVLDLFHTLKAERYVERVPNAETHDFILNRHYARRLPSISYAFGLFRGGALEGICTYGTPSSAPLRTGVRADLQKLLRKRQAVIAALLTEKG